MTNKGLYLYLLLWLPTVVCGQTEPPPRHEYDVLQLGFVQPNPGDGGVLLGTEYRRRVLPRVATGLRLAMALYGNTPDNQLLRAGGLFSCSVIGEYHFGSNLRKGPFVGGSAGILRSSFLRFQAGGGNTVGLASEGRTGVTTGVHCGYRTKCLRFTLGYVYALSDDLPRYWSLSLSPTLFL